MPRNLNVIVRSWIRLLFCSLSSHLALQNNLFPILFLFLGEALSAKQAANTAAAIFSLVGIAAAMALAFSWI